MSEEKTIVIMNNEARILTLPYAAPGQNLAGSYTLKIGRNHVPVKVLKNLTPGGKVDLARWEEIDWVTTPPNQEEESKKAAGPGSPPTLRGYPIDEKSPGDSLVFVFIKDETDVKVLRKWLNGESRENVRTAILDKIEDLKPKKPAKG